MNYDTFAIKKPKLQNYRQIFGLFDCLRLIHTRFFTKSFVKIFHHIFATYQLSKGQTSDRF